MHNLATDNALDICEDLSRASRANVVDPLINRLRRALARRFRAQALAHRRSGSITIIGVDRLVFRAVFRHTTGSAYDGGIALAGGQLGLIVTEAVQLATKRKPPGYDRTAEDLEDELDQTTDERIHGIITRGLKQGLTATAVALLIASQFRDWTVQRAEAVATYEVSKAYHQGAADVAKIAAEEAPGTQVLKQWEANPDACDICAGNVEDGFIPEDILFSSGADAPPEHGNCLCSLSYKNG